MTGHALIGALIAAAVAFGATDVGKALELHYKKLGCAMDRATVCVLDNNANTGVAVG